MQLLEQLTGRLFEIRKERNAEENRWRREQTNLQRTLALLDGEKSNYEQRIATLREREGTAGAERAKLAEELTAKRGRLEELDGKVRASATRLLAVHEGLPAPLRQLLAAAAARVRDALSPAGSALSVIDRLRVLNAFSAELDKVLGMPHAVKQVIEVDGQPRREMDVLYLGGALGYWVGAADRQAGLLVHRDGAWTVTRDDGLATQVRAAIQVIQRERPATIIRLPLPAEAGR